MQLGQTKGGVQELEQKINYIFNDKALITQALTHSSFANEMKINKCKNYERLEFLGDAVLELISSDLLYENYPDLPEGDLSKFRASLVCEPSLAYYARKLNIGKYILLGRGENATGGRDRDSILCDIMEGIIGAIYKDGGILAAKEFILKYILSNPEEKKQFYDSKSMLQELTQRKFKEGATYKLIKENGPEHNKTFEVEVAVLGRIICVGSGRNKKSAEQEAAYKALLILKNEG